MILLFVLLKLVLIAIGFYCANQMTSDNPLWVRLIVLSPCFTAIITLIALLQGNYIPFTADILKTITTIALYALVASAFSNNNWLNIRK